MKNYLISLFFAYLMLVLWGCAAPSETKTILKKENIQGETMGTTFSISYLDSTSVDFMDPLEQLLITFNQSVSTYISDSEISKFNQSDSLITAKEGHFFRNYARAFKVYQNTDGWFNPAVMPLVNYWGFGYQTKDIVQQIDSTAVERLLQLVQFDAVNVQEKGDSMILSKTVEGLELDFSAIAKGDAVDEVGRLLESKGIMNYYVEIGGEIRARGHTASGYPWRSGIRQPQEGTAAQSVQVGIQLEDLSVATSGNYENYLEDKTTGRKYAHTINPKTGYPEKNSLLSVSVFASDCATADAYATAFMAMGFEKTKSLLKQMPELQAYLIYADTNASLQVYATDQFEMLKLPQ